MEMINTLLELQMNVASSKIQQVLLSLIKKIKFESDHSLKPNDFNNDYFLLNHLIEQITKYERKAKKYELSKTGEANSKQSS